MDATLLSTVFARFPLIAKLFPNTMMQLQENKWLSNGRMKIDGGKVIVGSVIHEHVKWS